MFKYNAIKIDQDFDLDFVKYYQERQIQILNLLEQKKINQQQFRGLQEEFFFNSYEDFFIQRVECETDLIELV